MTPTTAPATTTPASPPSGYRRNAMAVLTAPLVARNYADLFSIFQYCHSPVSFLSRYLTNAGLYPWRVGLQTPTGPVSLNVYSPDDVQTVNEIFFRGDYAVDPAARVVVDFGSNIGVSAAYFLTRNPDCSCHCFEPLPRNVERLRENLAPFAGRYAVSAVAVGEGDSQVRFGWEPTGRYGAIGRDPERWKGDWIDVECRDSNDVLADVISRHGRIDILKIDIETLEAFVTQRIPASVAQRIGAIVVEWPFSENPLPRTHTMKRNRNISSFALAPPR